MCRQYGAHLVSLQEDLGGWEALGLTLREQIAEERRAQERERKLRAMTVVERAKAQARKRTWS
jgi:hypothetical protein